MAHQTCRRFEQVLNGHKTVLLQGATCGDEVDDGLGHPGDRTELNGAIEVHKLHRQIKGIEELTGAVGELAGHAAVGWKVSGPLVTATGLHSNRHATAAKAEINQLGHGELVLLENVETHHTQLGLPIGHIGRHITIANQKCPGTTTGGRQHQLAVVLIQDR